MKEVCTGFVAMNRKVLDDLDLDNAPSGMEFSSWFLMNTIGKKNMPTMWEEIKEDCTYEISRWRFRYL